MISFWAFYVNRKKQVITFLFLPFIFLYNGKKGSKVPIHKWFFYIFYPLQFWILNVLTFFLKIKG
ncbi:TraX family protein [Leptotrichia sp. HMT-225]|nr:TraX family protein [Leptotrichia sp. HMT-225]ERL25899.1 hypothetical protein HMPREF9108_01532 [Leptotrichia sp. oral taxon 225 str. F0581]WLD74279.1 TraX family protein [Leptotrichia sp. HMT-225]